MCMFLEVYGDPRGVIGVVYMRFGKYMRNRKCMVDRGLFGGEGYGGLMLSLELNKQASNLLKKLASPAWRIIEPMHAIKHIFGITKLSPSLQIRRRGTKKVSKI